MKKIVLMLLLLNSYLYSNSQSSLSRGDKQWNAGLGISTFGLPVYLGIDYGLRRNVTLNGEVSFHRDLYYKSSLKNMLGMVTRVDYHFNTLINIPPAWDLYLGLNLGLYTFFDRNYPATAAVGIGGHLGGRYFFNDKIGLNMEFGTGGQNLAGVKIGITSRILPKKRKKKKTTSS